jgi:AraC-like DNA-binding protein
VLHPGTAATRFSLTRHRPPADLAPFADFCWVVRWDLRGEPAHDQAILPHPNVNLAFEAAGPAVYGVDRRVFTRKIDGAGAVLGIRFRPGGFRPFYSARKISTLNDLVVPAADIFGPAADRTCAAVLAASSDEAMIAAAAGLLRAAGPRPDPVIDQVAAIVDRITADPELRRVASLADVSGIPERLFAEYVGVSPKWVMRRARLHEAALCADAGGDVDWATLAADLGYSDQAHLTRDFTATLGMPPSRYVTLGR